MVKVLHVTEALGGGIHSAIVNYTRVTPQHEHTVFARSREGQPTYPWPDGVLSQTYTGRIFDFLAAAAKRIRETRPDIVHLHSSYAGTIRMLPRLNTTIAYSPHCFAIERTTNSPIAQNAYRMAELLLTYNTDLLIAVSAHEASVARRLNSRTPCIVVPNFAGGVDETVKNLRSPNSHDTSTIVTVGRISDQKDPMFFGRVARELPNYRFIWIGDGDQSQRSRLLADGVEVTGWLKPREVRKQLSNARLYLHTAAWEGAPLSTLEAIAEGCPVLTRAIPSMVSLGYPVAGTQPHEVSESVQRYFQNENYSSKVIQKCQEIAAKSTPVEASRRLNTAYNYIYEKKHKKQKVR